MTDRIAIMGGSFNPIHNGHIELARYLVKNSIVQSVYIMPSVQNPFKVGSSDYTDALHRYHMISKSLTYDDDVNLRIRVNNFEMKEFSNSECVYAADMLRKFIYTFPNNHSIERPIYYIIGADTFNVLSEFKDSEWITSSGFVRIIVLKRPGVELKKELVDTTNCIFVSDTPQFDISSTHVRELIRNGKYDEAKKIAPEEVVDYAVKHKLYDK